jgi:hypothetical protein
MAELTLCWEKSKTQQHVTMHQSFQLVDFEDINGRSSDWGFANQ